MRTEKIGEDRGKITSTRVLLDQPDKFKVEVSFEASGSLLGVEVSEIGTYSSTMQPDGTLYGEGQGIMKTESGDTITWCGSGLGRSTGPGHSAKWQATLYYQTSSSKLARLNQTVGLVEFESDAEGNCKSFTNQWQQ